MGSYDKLSIRERMSKARQNVSLPSGMQVQFYLVNQNPGGERQRSGSCLALALANHCKSPGEICYKRDKAPLPLRELIEQKICVALVDCESWRRHSLYVQVREARKECLDRHSHSIELSVGRSSPTRSTVASNGSVFHVLAFSKPACEPTKGSAADRQSVRVWI